MKKPVILILLTSAVGLIGAADSSNHKHGALRGGNERNSRDKIYANTTTHSVFGKQAESQRQLMPTCIYRDDPRLVGYWPGNGDALDHSGHGHHGEWCTHDGDCDTEGAYGESSDGRKGFWLSANIDDDDDDLPDKFVYIPSSQGNEFDETGSFSLSFWMQDRFQNKFDLLGTVVGKMASDETNPAFRVASWYRPEGWRIMNFIQAALQDAQVTDRLRPAGPWVHVAMISSGSKLSLYLNNQLRSEENFSETLPSRSGILAFGNSGKTFDYASQPLKNGLLRHVTFWDDGLGTTDLWRLKTYGICKVETSFFLVDTNKQEDIGHLDYDVTINLFDLPKDALSIRVWFVPVVSVKLELRGEDGTFIHDKVENVAPYTLFGETGEKINAGPIPVGRHILKATFYSERGARGSVINTKSIAFTVIEVDYSSKPEPPPRSCVDRCIDFSKKADGSTLAHGDYVKSDWEAWGMTITAASIDGGYTPNDMARIFDTATPISADPDLGSPNQACPGGGGPGVGKGGEPGKPGENCKPQGNVVIIQETDKDEVDDNASGGTLKFAFQSPATVKTMTLLDIDTPDEAVLALNKVDGNSIRLTDVGGSGDNSVAQVELNENDIASLDVEFRRSGAVSEICFCV